MNTNESVSEPAPTECAEILDLQSRPHTHTRFTLPPPEDVIEEYARSIAAEQIRRSLTPPESPLLAALLPYNPVAGPEHLRKKVIERLEQAQVTLETHGRDRDLIAVRVTLDELIDHVREGGVNQNRLRETWAFTKRTLRILGAEAQESIETVVYDRQPVEDEQEKPKYDPANRALTARGEEKRYRRNALHQTKILAAFEAAGWPKIMGSPIPGLEGERLNDTINNLCKSLAKMPIRFRGDGTGTAIVWEWVQ